MDGKFRKGGEGGTKKKKKGMEWNGNEKSQPATSVSQF